MSNPVETKKKSFLASPRVFKCAALLLICLHLGIIGGIFSGIFVFIDVFLFCFLFFWAWRYGDPVVLPNTQQWSPATGIIAPVVQEERRAYDPFFDESPRRHEVPASYFSSLTYDEERRRSELLASSQDHWHTAFHHHSPPPPDFSTSSSSYSSSTSDSMRWD